MPAFGIALGFFVALCPGLRDLFSKKSGVPIFGFAFSAISYLGDVAVPANLVILGASIARQASHFPFFSRTQSHFLENAVVDEGKAYMNVAFAKLVVLPIFGTAFGIACKITDSMPAPAILTAMLVTATPTSNEIILMAEIAGSPTPKHALGSALFVQYIFLPVILTAWLVLFIIVSGYNINI